MNKETETYTKQILAEKVHLSVSSLQFSPVGGGSVNDTWKITVNNNRRFFIKINDRDKFPTLFETEKSGLHFIAEKKIIRTPSVIDSAVTETKQVLILEWIEQGHKSQSFWKTFGEQLAKLHRETSDNFGFFEKNYMGALPQANTYSKTWIDFFVQNRLRPQIKLAFDQRLLSAENIASFEKLYPQLKNIFNEEVPSLLHGDLWSGNFICDESSSPVLIDPAAYFGHRSMDLAMTTLFGGFDKEFYDSYNYHFPMPANYKEQWDICNLCPLLIHLNLFGSGYLHEIVTILRKFTG